jgi:hypothetical protein
LKFFFTLILFAFLTSCSTTRKEPIVVMDEAYLNCEIIHSQFSDIFECIKSDDSTKDLKTDESDLLFLKGEQLEEKINKGQLSSVDAKFEWKKLVFDIKQQLAESRYMRMNESIYHYNYRRWY